MLVSRSAYHDWVKRPATLITANELQLYRRTKQLFEASRGSLGSREMVKKLRKEGFNIGRYRVCSLMKRLGLKVIQRQAYRVTTQRKNAHPVAENVINQDFNPEKSNQVWAGDVTYLRTHEGWMYLAIVMDLYSRRIIGWAIHKRMTVDLVSRAMQMAINLRNPDKGLIFHSDQGSQYTSKVFGALLKGRTIRASMSGVGACWDNAVVERFFGSLKNEWLLKIYHLTRQGMKQDVEAYIRYYNQDRLHTANGDLSPVEYELSQIGALLSW
jgi:putative transposase